uniref:(northern house mosquito) hypothetical protein n=1 Tax=Culex pipiens TaxID=7175 RepID=A0A8D8C9D2_CULPI
MDTNRRNNHHNHAINHRKILVQSAAPAVDLRRPVRQCGQQRQRRRQVNVRRSRQRHETELSGARRCEAGRRRRRRSGCVVERRGSAAALQAHHDQLHPGDGD